MEEINYLCNGALGDFLLLLYVINDNYKTTGKKGNIFIGMKFFTFKGVYEDIEFFVKSQQYVNLFEKYTNQHIDINLDTWRKSHLLRKENILSILSNHYNIKEPLNFTPWLECGYDEKYSDMIIINRSVRRHTNSFPWNIITSKNKCFFLSFEINDYENFPCKNNVELLHIKTFDEMSTIINSCKFFVGNQSAQSVLAYILKKPCFIELYGADASQSIGLEKYNDFSWMFKEEKRIGKNFFLNLK